LINLGFFIPRINPSFSEYDGEQEKKLNDGRSFRKRWIDSRNKETEINQIDKEQRGDEVEYNNSSSKQAREGVNGVISQYIDKWEYGIKTDFDIVGEKIRNESFRNDISGYLNKLMSDKSEVAIALRSFLSRLYYSSFEQFEDDDLAAIYGDLFYSSDDLANDGFLAGKSRLEIFDIILNLEEMLLDGNGEITIPSEIASVGEILLKKMN
jgi:ribosomal protein S17E